MTDDAIALPHSICLCIFDLPPLLIQGEGDRGRGLNSFMVSMKLDVEVFSNERF
jgi:hypothetical protein